jgi:hypothetical protein
LKGEQAVLPDATFTLAEQRYFVEIDMGTTNLRSWGEKIRAYEAYRQSSRLQARYGVDTFMILGFQQQGNQKVALRKFITIRKRSLNGLLGPSPTFMP